MKESYIFLSMVKERIKTDRKNVIIFSCYLPILCSMKDLQCMGTKHIQIRRKTYGSNAPNMGSDFVGCP